MSVLGLYYEDRVHAECMRRYNEAQSAVARERTAANNADWAALDALIRALNAGVPDPKAETQRYLDTRTQTLQQRAENPLVPPPSDYCS